MRWSYNLERAYSAAVWLFVVAGLVFVMVVVGGATRLTGSGLSITEWRPVTGVIPPLSAHGWALEFQKYQTIPQYRLVNQGLSIGAFKSLYWWEWTHRLLGRLVGAALVIPFVVLLYLRRIPRRLIWRCAVLIGLVGLEGLVGWWMVASGLSTRVSVAPERLATHLAIALLILIGALWTGLEAWFGRARAAFPPDRTWVIYAFGLAGLVFVQMLLGALVAGNRAGQVYTDWPTMGGRLIPADYAPKGARLWTVLAHNAASVQLHHRLLAYVIAILVVVFVAMAWRARRVPLQIKQLAAVLAGLVGLQVILGILTLHFAAPLGLSLPHQALAVCVLATTVALAWRVQRN